MFFQQLYPLVINWDRKSGMWMVFFSGNKFMLADLFSLRKCGSGSCWWVCPLSHWSTQLTSDTSLQGRNGLDALPSLTSM